MFGYEDDPISWPSSGSGRKEPEPEYPVRHVGHFQDAARVDNPIAAYRSNPEWAWIQAIAAVVAGWAKEPMPIGDPVADAAVLVESPEWRAAAAAAEIMRGENPVKTCNRYGVKASDFEVFDPHFIAEIAQQADFN